MESSLAIEAAPYELLVLVTSWLSVYDVMFGLRPVSRLFNAISHDPVTWARIHVDVRSYEELVYFLFKYGESITSVQSCFNRHIKVFEICPNLRSVDAFVPTYLGVEPPTPTVVPSLRHIRVDRLSDVYRPCLTDLRSLSAVSIQVEPSMISSLTSLSFPGFFAEFPPETFTHLKKLHCVADNVCPAHWDMFAASHPYLVDLTLERFSLAGDELVVESYPTQLWSFSYRGFRSTASDFLRGMLECNPGLRSLEVVEPRLDASFVPVVAELKHLTAIRMLSFDVSASIDDIHPLRALPLLDCTVYGRPGTFGRHTAPLGVAPRKLSVYHAECSLGEENGSALTHVREISFAYACHGSLVREIGEYCRRIRSLEFMSVKIPDNIELIAPALTSVEVFTVHHCEGDHRALARALAPAVELRDLRVSVKPPSELNEFLRTVLLSLPVPFRFQTLAIAEGDLATLELMELIVESRCLRALSASVGVSGDREELMEVWGRFAGQLPLWSPKLVKIHIFE